MSEILPIFQNKIVQIALIIFGFSLIGPLFFILLDIRIIFSTGVYKVFMIICLIGMFLFNIGIEMAKVKWRIRYAVVGMVICIPWIYLLFVPAFTTNPPSNDFAMWGIYAVGISSMLIMSTYRKRNQW